MELSGILITIGVLCALYGIILRVFRAGTGFYPIWFAIGGGIVALGLCTHYGVWARLPLGLLWVLGGLGSVCVVCFLIMQCLFLSGFGAKGRPGLDYIIILGAQVKPRGPSIALRHRLDRALKYLNENPETCCVVSGGQGGEEPWTEAEGMARYLMEKGLPECRIIREGASTSTLENLRFSMDMLPEGASVGIVTNNFHVFRAMQLARLLGYTNTVGIAAHATPGYLPNNLLRECFGEAKLILMILSGKLKSQ